MKTQLLFSSYPFISGEKVTLSRVTEIDLKALWAILGDEENFRYLPSAPAASPVESNRRLLHAEQLFRERRALVLGIYPAQGEYRLIGLLGISEPDEQVESCALSFILNRAYTQQGFASSAVRAVCGYLFDTIGVHRIQCAILPTNYRAAVVLERCRFQREGTLRESRLWPDKGLVDLTVYSLLPSDLREKGSSGRVYF